MRFVVLRSGEPRAVAVLRSSGSALLDDAAMSIVVFNPHTVEDVDFADRMRHPSMQDPAGGMWLSDTEPSWLAIG